MNTMDIYDLKQQYNFGRRDFNDLDLSKVQIYRNMEVCLSGASFKWCCGNANDFIGLEASETNFSYSVLRFTVAANCDFTKAVFFKTKIKESTFKQCLFIGADFAQACLIKVVLDGSHWTRAVMNHANVVGCDFNEATIADADFSKSVLAVCEFYQAFICQTDLSHCDMTQCDLTEAMVDGVNLTGALLHKAQFKGAELKYLILTSNLPGE